MSGHIVLASGDAGRARSCPPYCGAGERPKLSICSKSCKPARWETLRPATITAACLSGEPVKPLEALSACYIGCLLALMGARLASSICLPLSVNSPAAKHLGFLATLVAGSGRQRLGIALLAADGLIISQTDIASTPFFDFFLKNFSTFSQNVAIEHLTRTKKFAQIVRIAPSSPSVPAKMTLACTLDAPRLPGRAAITRLCRAAAIHDLYYSASCHACALAHALTHACSHARMRVCAHVPPSIYMLSLILYSLYLFVSCVLVYPSVVPRDPHRLTHILAPISICCKGEGRGGLPRRARARIVCFAL